MFDRLIRWHCHTRSAAVRRVTTQLLEKLYGCEIRGDIDASVRFAHHARGCTIVAAKICENVVIYQHVTIGSNLRFDRSANAWENVGTPIIARNVVICDGAKILGPIEVGENSVIAAGAIVTRDVPPDSVVSGVNGVRPRNPSVDLVYRADMIAPAAIIEANRLRVEAFEKTRRSKGHPQ